MTNKDKFLKAGVSVEEVANEIGTLISNGYSAGANRKEFWCVNEVEKWLEEQTTPTLTDDERVILRNMKCCGEIVKTIERDKTGDLLVLSCNFSKYITMYDHLFQFVKEGEEYSIEELLK